MNSPKKCPTTIEAIFEAWRSKSRGELIEEGRVYLVPTNEIVDNGYRKLPRTEENALAPDKIKNKSPQDMEAGKANYREIRESIREQGFDPLRPLTFLIRKNWQKIRLHQGHHRLGVAEELGVSEVPVLFLYDRKH